MQAAVSTLFFISGKLIRGPLLQMIGLRPVTASDAEVDYEVSIVCHGEVEAHVRALLLRDLGHSLLILELESSNVEDSNRVEVSALVRSEKRQDRALEQIVGRLSLEPMVTASRWRLSHTTSE